MIPVTSQEKNRSWKATNFSYLVPYADVKAPFSAALQTLRQGKDTDQSTLDLFALSLKRFFDKSVEPLQLSEVVKKYSKLLMVTYLSLRLKEIYMIQC